MSKLCPFDHFNPCKEAECGVSIDVDGKPVCSLAFAAHELFLIADATMRKNADQPNVNIDKNDD